jgi:hypothetical protein
MENEHPFDLLTGTQQHRLIMAVQFEYGRNKPLPYYLRVRHAVRKHFSKLTFLSFEELVNAARYSSAVKTEIRYLSAAY